MEAAQAGAAIVHIHVREPSTGQGSRRPEYFREVVERIRDAKTDVLINLTTGMGGDLVIGADGMNDTPAPGTDCVGPMERLVHVEELHPDICSLDCGSMNFDDDSMLFVMTPSYLRASAKRIKELGVRPELEVFELGHIELSKRLIGEGLIDAGALPDLPRHLLRRARHAEGDAGDARAYCRKGRTGAVLPSAGWRCLWSLRRCSWAAISASASKTTFTFLEGCSPRTPILSGVQRRSWRAWEGGLPVLPRLGTVWHPEPTSEFGAVTGLRR